MFKTLPSLCLLLFLLTGCDESLSQYHSPLHTNNYISTHQSIINGKLADDPVYHNIAALVLIADNNIYPFCSGILINNNVLLTSAHCLISTQDFPFNDFYHNHQIAVINEQSIHPDNHPQIHGIETYALHPEFESFTHRHDIALVYIDDEIEDISPISLNHNPDLINDFIEHQTPVIFAGYGQDEDNHTGSKRFFTSAISSYCPSGTCKKHLPDSPDELITMPKGTLLHHLNAGGPCKGDSGGPILRISDNTMQVLGIISFGDEACQRYAVSTDVADNISWIENTLSPSAESCQIQWTSPRFHITAPLIFAALLVAARRHRRPLFR